MANQTVSSVDSGSLKFSKGLKTSFIVMTVVGFAIFGFTLMKDPHRAWPNFLINYFYFLGFAACGIVFTAIQHISNAYWSVTIRRLLESFMSWLPVALVFAVAIFLGRHELYEWTHIGKKVAIAHHSEHGMEILRQKAPYLNSTFFAVRLFLFLGLWTWLGFKMRKNSLDQDKTGEHKFTLSNIRLACVLIPLFGVSFTLMSFDLIMSLEPLWFSTIFGVYCFAGSMFAGMAFIAILLIYGRKTGVFSEKVLNDNHMHDVGKMMFTFVVFWAYIMFSQLMLQWYANLPEEIPYYLRRFAGGWWNVGVVLFVIHFIIPFFLLLPRDRKRDPAFLKKMAWLMLFAQWLDVYYMVMPVFFKDGPVFGIAEIGTAMGFIGLFGITVSRFLEKVPAIPVKDPRLLECIGHTQ